MSTFNCDNCKDQLWVCEDHPDRPWHNAEPDCCGGAGMPCQECNLSMGPNDPPRMPPGFVEMWRINPTAQGE